MVRAGFSHASSPCAAIANLDMYALISLCAYYITTALLLSSCGLPPVSVHTYGPECNQKRYGNLVVSRREKADPLHDSAARCEEEKEGPAGLEGAMSLLQ